MVIAGVGEGDSDAEILAIGAAVLGTVGTTEAQPASKMVIPAAQLYFKKASLRRPIIISRPGAKAQ
jgi:hypothetical protein